MKVADRKKVTEFKGEGRVVECKCKWSVLLSGFEVEFFFLSGL